MAAQPDRTAEIEKAKTKFEKDIAKAEETFLANFDKAISKAQTGGNKALTEKLTFEREQFAKSHIVPTALPSDTYLRQRNQAIAALQTAYKPRIADLTKAKKFDELMATEDTLSELLTTARGYGLAFPDLETHPIFLIENPITGLVIDTTENGSGSLVAVPKVGKSRPAQCWRLYREEKGFIVRNVGSGNGFHVPGGSRDAGTTVVMWSVDPTKGAGTWSLFKLTETHREVVIESTLNDLILTATERKEKGVTTTYITQEKKEAKVLPSQTWKFVELKQ
jgi:hypothetical protein